jgi:hypothetical protein
MAVGPDQIGQHLGIAAVGLGPRDLVAAAVAADDLRVDRIHLVTSDQQRADQQPPVGLDPDRHLRRFLGMGGHQRVQFPHSGQPIGDSAGG